MVQYSSVASCFRGINVNVKANESFGSLMFTHSLKHKHTQVVKIPECTRRKALLFPISGVSRVDVGLVLLLQYGTGVDSDGLVQSNRLVCDENTASV